MAYRDYRDNRESLGYKGRKLTLKMHSFIDAYFGEANFNALEAMRLSDYKCTTPASIDQTTAELMNHPLVMEEIKRRTALRSEKSEIKAEYLLNKLIQIIDDVSDQEKTADKLRAIELAGKAIALWKDRQEISGPDGEAIRHEQHVKESVAEFTTRIETLAKRGGNAGGDEPEGTENIVSFPRRGGAS